MTTKDTRTAILDAAQELLQTRGFNAFSIKDLAERIGIRTSSIHYHFPTKADLCRALIARHRRLVGEVLSEIDRDVTEPRKKLERFSSVFQGTIESGNRMCPFGMLAAEAETLEAGSCDELRGSFQDMETWLKKVLTQAKASGQLSYGGSAIDEARLILSTLEGAMLVARTHQDPKRFAAVARRLLAKF